MDTRTPFRFGVVTSQAPSGSAWLDRARRVEALGYDTLVMPDNVAAGLSVFPALAAAAAATSRLRVGSYVLANDFRHPVQVAKDAVALAVLSEGRFELGLGAGRPGADRDNAMLGLHWDDAGTRVSRLAESVSIIKRLVAGATVTADGPHYRATEASVVPPGVEPPPVPVLVAARGPRMLDLAGREADIAALGVPFDMDAEAVAGLAGRVRAAAGDRPVELNLNLMAVGDAVPRFLAGRLDPAALAAAGSVCVVTGSAEEMAGQVRDRRERLGLSYLLVADELMEAFAPVVAILAGE
ncbi:probable F420-dependent oxidoreductase, MSMEG_2516 family [Nocardioides terrae]|uniref:Probable F420-dependent oxidoreductase, MSMEG_2516 family n=1 Tax=Nocardioides terrae TaxID=574651 RepID=A0A1I1LNV5_9ACTN|nr:TIGR03621 family F420-dependent LLM class oxidoreductase [Nocardioides terrae]SFC71983.1 probable F420-dependent oxidoreductase, MSMEG_2516 family [Nocardioides terrae]